MAEQNAGTSRSRITDSISVEVNGEPTTKEADPERLAEHDAEAAAFEARLAAESGGDEREA